MDLATLSIEQDEMVELQQRYAKPQDTRSKELAEAMCSLLDGKIVIDFAQSILNAGPDPQWKEIGVPRLAVAPADETGVRLRVYANNSIRFSFRYGSLSMAWENPLRGDSSWAFSAPTPIVPPDIQRKYKTEKHHIIWEPVWESVPLPEDPILCRRIGDTLLFVEVAHWDITPLESSILNGTW